MHNINSNSVYLIYKYSVEYLEYFVRVWTLCAARCFVKKKKGFRCLNVNFFLIDIYIFACVFGCVKLCILFSLITYQQAYMQENPPSTVANCVFPPVRLSSDLQKPPKSKYPLTAFLHVRAELNMHLLPVANCEWNAFDIMRSLVLYSCVRAHSSEICLTVWAYFYCFIANALCLY